MTSMTVAQREALQRIRLLQDAQVKSLAQVAADMGGVPSRWLFEHTLTTIHHMRRSTIRAMVSKGILLKRSTDGFGSQVIPADDAEYVATRETCFHCGAAALAHTYGDSPRCERHSDV